MELSELLKIYTEISTTKSGLLMTAGKCVYLYNNVCCEAICRRVLLRAENTEILAERADDLLVYRSGADLCAYKNTQRILKISELIILYEIPSDEGSLNGVFACGNNLRLMDSHFTDNRITELINHLIIGETSSDHMKVEEFKRLEEALRTGELSALNKIYVNGKKIQDGGIL